MTFLRCAFVALLSSALGSRAGNAAPSAGRRGASALGQGSRLAFVAAAMLLFALIPSAGAQTYMTPVLGTYAGNGGTTAPTSGSAATSTSLVQPLGLTVDRSGNVYGLSGGEIYRIDARTRVVTNLFNAGDLVYGMVLDSTGSNLYIAKYYGACIVGYNLATATQTTVAGQCGSGGYSGDGGAATSAKLNGPTGLAISGSTIYIADSGNFRIRAFTVGGNISTIAGNGVQGYAGDNVGGGALNAEFNGLYGLAVDQYGDLVIADSGNHRVRYYTYNSINGGEVSTLIGTGTSGNTVPHNDPNSPYGGQVTSVNISAPSGIAVGPDGSYYIADAGNNEVYVFKSSNGVNVFTGNGTAGYAGDGTWPYNTGATEVSNPVGVAVDGNNTVYIADYGNNRLRSAGYNLQFPTTAVGSSVSQVVIFTFGTNTTLNGESIPASQSGSNDFTYTLNSATCGNGSPVTAFYYYCYGTVTYTPQYPGIRTAPLQISTAQDTNFRASLAGAATGPLADFQSGTESVVIGNSQSTQNATDGAGNFYYAYGNGIYKITPSGVASLYLSGLTITPSAIAVDPAGDVFYWANGGSEVYVKPYDSANTSLVNTSIPGLYDGLGQTGFYDPLSGYLYVTAGGQFVPELIQVNPRLGTYHVVVANGTSISGTCSGGTGAQVSGILFGVTVDQNDNIYGGTEFGTSNNECIFKLPSGTYNAAAYSANPALGTIAVSPAGSVYTPNGLSLLEYPSSGGTVTLNTPLDAGAGYSNANGVTIDGAGNLYFQYQDGTVTKYTRTTAPVTFPTSGGTDYVYDTYTQPLVMESNGTSALSFSNFAYTGTTFGESSMGCSTSSTLLPGYSCSLTVGFSPVAAGTTTGSAVYTDNSAPSYPSTTATQTATFTGTAVADVTATYPYTSNSPTGPTASTTLTVYVSDSSATSVPTGTVSITNGGTAISSCTNLALTSYNTNNAIATCTYSYTGLANGSYTLTATYTPSNGNYASSSGTVTQVVSKNTTTTTLASSANPSYSGASVTFTATVSYSGSATAPTGTVTFMSGASTLGTGTISGTTATYTTSALPIGTSSITAVYNGDTNNVGSTSSALSQVVQADVTTTSVTSSNNPTGETASTTLTVTVTDSSLTAVPTGTVSITSGGTAISGCSSLTLSSYSSNSARATCTYSYSSMSTGNYTLTATYTPSSTSYASSSGTVTQTVTQNTATATLTMSSNAATAGTTITFTSNVGYSGSLAAPTGTVSFYANYGALGICAATVSGGVATCTSSTVPTGSYPVQAYYGGDSNNTPAYSGTQTLVISPVTASAAAAPTTPVASTSATQTVTFTFAGTETLGSAGAVVTYGLTGGYDEFAIVTGGTCTSGTTYTSGQTCTVKYNFTPQYPGLRSGAIQLYNNASTPSLIAETFISGVGTAPLALFTDGTVTSPVSSGNNSPQVAVSSEYVYAVVNSNLTEYLLPNLSSSTTLISGVGSQFEDLAVDGAGNVYGWIYGGTTIYELPSGGTSLVTIATSTPTLDHGGVVDGQGNLYVGLNAGGVLKVSAATHAVSTFIATGTTPSGGGTFQRATGMAMDSAGDLFITDFANNAVYEVTSGSSTLKTLAYNDGLLNGPHGVAVDPAGDLYVVNYNNGNLLKYTPNSSGTYSGVQLPFSQTSQLLSVTIGSGGNLFLSSGVYPGSSGVVYKYARTSGQTLTYSNVAVNSTSTAQQEAIENDGNTALTISSVGVTASTPFAATGVSPYCNGSLAVAASCNVSVTFSPTSSGSFTSNAIVTDNSLNVSGTTQTFGLYGTTSSAASGTTAQTITFPQPTTPQSYTAGSTTVTLAATASSGLAVTYVVTSGSATVAGSTLTPTGPGSVTVTAYQYGNATYSAATPVAVTIVFQATSIIQWSPAQLNIRAGAQIGSGNLDANAVYVSGTSPSGGSTYTTVPGTFTYAAQLTSGGSSTTVTSTSTLSAGVYYITATFTPSNTSSYTTATSTVTLFASNGSMYVANSNGTVSTYARTNGAIASNSVAGGGIGLAPAPSNGFGPSGGVWSIATGTGQTSIQSYSDGGTASTVLSYQNASGASATSGTTAIAADGASNLWVAQSETVSGGTGGDIGLISNTVPPHRIAGDANIGTPTGIAIDSAGSIWVTSANNTVIEVIGAATPVTTSTAQALANGTLAKQP